MIFNKTLNLQNEISLQCPLFNKLYGRKCAFIDINTFFLPGLMIAYTYRYGRSTKVYVYFIVYLIGMMVGLLLWIFTTLQIEFVLPR